MEWYEEGTMSDLIEEWEKTYYFDDDGTYEEWEEE